MFKKTFQIVTTFGVLLAGYASYVQVFAIIAAGVGQPSPARIWKKEPSRTEREARRLAQEGFGPRHWTADKELPVRYYNHERGYWMYAKTYQRLNDGKQLRFRPFALIWRSHDGKGLKTATSEEAIVDLDQPLGLVSKSGSAMKVLHARIEGNVRLRDDKGTPNQLADDLVIGPMPYVEYDEPTLQIKSESDVIIQDRDMRITGYDLLIQLRPRDEGTTPASSSGNFDAKTAFIKKNVHLILNDVGNSGILPGTAKPEQAQGNRTPLDVRCIGPMQVELPKPKHRVRVGPPAPPLPTLVFFYREVVVQRGRAGQAPDQLDCDELSLELVPNPKPKPAPVKGQDRPGELAANANVNLNMNPDASASTDPAAPPEATGAGTEMTLRKAHATGHAVWLQSKSQGTTARCNELIHKKLGPDQPDETYLRGDPTMKLWVEKIETVPDGPDKGKIQSVTTIRTTDATIFEDGQGQGQGNDNATIVARGPGIMETRPARNKPVERKAIWQDHLILQPKLGPDKQPHKEIVLIGRPEFIDDPAKTTLDARDRIYVWLKPKPKVDASLLPGSMGQTSSSSAATAAPKEKEGGQAYQIEKLKALVDVHLNAPDRVLNARDSLDAVFETPEPARAKAGQVPAPAPGQAPAQTPADPSGKPATPAEKEPRPDAPDMTITADRVWASIRLSPDAGASGTTSTQATGKGEVQIVRLRGGVVFHEDPAKGKTQGTDVTGEALDLNNLGNGKMSFQVEQYDPHSPIRTGKPVARVVTEEMTIIGPTIGLDQRNDVAWVNGAGTLTMMAKRDLLTDKGLDETRQPAANAPKVVAKPARARAKADPSREPMKISWNGKDSMMRFFGSADNPKGGPKVAKAEFHRNVRALMTDAELYCRDRLDTYMDRTVALARPKREAGQAEEPEREAEPKPQIAWIDCLGDAAVVSRKLDPVTGILMQKQLIESDRITYDKASGEFYTPKGGVVCLWNREGEAKGGPTFAAPATARRPVTPTSNPPRSAPAGTGANARRGSNPMTARNSNQPPQPRRAGGAPPANGNNNNNTAARQTLLPLKLTVISYEQSMKGRYMAGKDTDTTEPRWATFLGDVQTMNARVDDDTTMFNFDRPPADFMFLTAQRLDVRSDPTPGEKTAARNYLKATSESQARTRNETISADIITYDSQKELFYAYSDVGHMVRIARQSSLGQPVSGGQSQAVKYNRLTGESEFIKPLGHMYFVDANSGARPGPAPEAKDKPLKPTRFGPSMRIPGRSLLERKGMTGH